MPLVPLLVISLAQLLDSQLEPSRRSGMSAFYHLINEATYRSHIDAMDIQ
jgi:hypothetical protein